MVTIYDIARMAGVSRGTVDRVIHKRGKVKPEIQERVEQIIREVQYRPNTAARALKFNANPLRIGFVIPPLTNQFFQQVLEGVHSAARIYSLSGVKVEVEVAQQYDQSHIREKVELLVQSGVDAIALNAIDEKELATYIDEVCKLMPVVTYNSDFSASERICFVGQDLFASGQVASDLMGKSLGQKGGVVAFISRQDILSHTQRISGFLSVIHKKYPDIHLLEIVETQDCDSIAYQKTKEVLNRWPELNGIFVAGGGAVGVGNALKETGKPKGLCCICYDLLLETVEHVKQEIIDYTIGQEPFLQGYLPVTILSDYLLLGSLPKDKNILTHIDIRTQYNIDSQTSEMFNMSLNHIQEHGVP